jgi:exodeoxyribonuclease VIII
MKLVETELTAPVKPGIYAISNAQYHAREGISRSAISELKKSPLHYWDRYINPERGEEGASPAMILGSAVHYLALEPNNFEKEFVIARKEGRYWRAENADNKQVIKEDEVVKAQKIANSILEHPKTAALLDGANIEKSIYWEDEDTGLLCKARPDIWNPEIGVICEIKTSREINGNSFSYTIKSGDYHLQAAMQLDAIYYATGIKINSFVIMLAPTTRPYKPYLYLLDDAVIAAGRREYKDALKLAKKCIESGRWDADRDKVQLVNFSEYQLTNNTLFNLMEIYQCQK